MRLFKKKEDFKETEESEGESEAPATGADSKSGYRFSADFEKLKAKVEALSELRKSDSERFTGISEQIGEIHNLILDKEKAIEEVNTKATKAADLVAELQPESIIAELKKASIKYESFDAKIEAINSLYRKVLEEVKGMRSRLTFLKGTEELINLNKETAENLVRIRKSEANIERHENKVGNMFIQFQKQFAEFSRFRDWAESAEEEFKKIKGEFDNVRIKADSTLIGRKDLDAVRLELQEKIAEIESKTAGISKLEFEKNAEKLEKAVDAIMASMEKKIAKIKADTTVIGQKDLDALKLELQENIDEIKADSTLIRQKDLDALKLELQEKIAETESRMTGLSEVEFEKKAEQLDKAVDARIAGMEGNIASLNDSMNRLTSSIEEKWSVVEGMEQELQKETQEVSTLEGEYYTLAKEVGNIAKLGASREAIIKYNMLKEMYNELIRRAYPAEKSGEIYSVLKQAFETVNRAKNRTE